MSQSEAKPRVAEPKERSAADSRRALRMDWPTRQRGHIRTWDIGVSPSGRPGVRGGVHGVGAATPTPEGGIGEAVLTGEGEQGKAAVAMQPEDGLDLAPGPARASRRGARHGVHGLHPPILPEHPAPTHDGSAGRLRSIGGKPGSSSAPDAIGWRQPPAQAPALPARAFHPDGPAGAPRLDPMSCPSLNAARSRQGPPPCTRGSPTPPRTGSGRPGPPCPACRPRCGGKIGRAHV